MAQAQPCVLVVEDEGAQREVLKYNLESEGFSVVMAENGDEAMLLVAEEQPDLIVLDVMMPGMDGFEVASADARQSAYAADTDHLRVRHRPDA